MAGAMAHTIEFPRTIIFRTTEAQWQFLSGLSEGVASISGVTRDLLDETMEHSNTDTAHEAKGLTRVLRLHLSKSQWEALDRARGDSQSAADLLREMVDDLNGGNDGDGRKKSK